MEKYLFFLLVFGFAGLVIFGLSLLTALVVTVLLALVYIAIRYPHPMTEWPYTRGETYRFIMLSGFGMLLVALLNSLREEFSRLSVNAICSATLLIGFAGLLILGMLFPRGLPAASGAGEED